MSKVDVSVAEVLAAVAAGKPQLVAEKLSVKDFKGKGPTKQKK